MTAPGPLAAHTKSGIVHTMHLDFVPETGRPIRNNGSLQENPPSRIGNLPEGVGTGRLRFGRVATGTNAETGIDFAWDSKGKVLYLDLNDNGSLNDDPAGICHTKSSHQDYLQEFNDIAVTRTIDGLAVPYRLRIGCYSFGHYYTSIMSGWRGAADLDDRTWAITVSDDGDGRIDTGGRDRVVVNPVAENGNLLTTDLSPPRGLFLGKRLYTLEYLFLQNDGEMGLDIHLKPKDAALGRVRIAGAFVQKLALTSDARETAILVEPHGEVELPASHYWQSHVGVFNPRVNWNGVYTAEFETDLWIKNGATTDFRIGGPLYNAASLDCFGKHISISCRILGQSGNEYEGHDPENVAVFAVMQDGRERTTGTLEYG